MQNRTVRILLTGSNGQVGRELRRTLSPLGAVTALDRTSLDLADPDAIRKTVREHRPNLIVNAAAYTAVDRAESEPELAMAVNGIAPGILAEEARRLGAVLVHYSTDYVFDGTKATAYTEADTPNPLNVYGRTKLAGERAIQAADAAHYILRTSWVYAAEGTNFLNTILQLARERPELRIVDDQTGAPTWARAIADMTAQLLTMNLRAPNKMKPPLPASGERVGVRRLENVILLSALNNDNPKFGLYHLAASGAVTWFGFARAILAEAEKALDISVPRLIPVSTAEYPLPARRPANSRLDTTRLTTTFGIMPASWQEMLAQCMREKFSRRGIYPGPGCSG